MPTDQTNSLLRVDRVSLASRIGAAKRSRAPLSGIPNLLEDISFEVFRGDRIAVIGPSGAGKTSLLRLLNRLNEPSSGTIFLEGEDYRKMSPVMLRQQIVLLLQESKLLGMTVQQALEYPLMLRGCPDSVRQQRIAEWLDQLHIPTEWLDRTEVQLSVGQRQLVAIARALITLPKVLLLDEPTSALDLGRSQLVLEAIAELTQTVQTAVLLVSHELERTKQFCNRVLYLQQGRLLQDSKTQKVDWSLLQQTLLQAEAEQAEEWE